MENTARNPFTWVEIYVDDMHRAQCFYETVFAIQLIDLPTSEDMGELQMKSFPWNNDQPNISGALVKMDDIKAGAGGTMVYFACEDCALEESRVESAGGKVLQPKMPIGAYGFCSVVMDTEGNNIGLHSMK